MTGPEAAPRIERALVVAGLGFGDEGKGSLVDWLVRVHGAETVIRYNGGAQAAHHVVTDDGRSHCFAQFGAGTLVPGVRTFLSRFVLVDPLALVAEERALEGIGVRDAYQRLTVDPGCVIVTPYHRILNQMRELARGEGRHGSCGLGMAEARLDSERPGLPVLRVGDILDPDRLRSRLKLVWLSKLDQAEQLCDGHPDTPALAAALADLGRADRVEGLAAAYHDLAVASGVTIDPRPALGRTVVFEGAQGVLLDRDLGFWPHVTPSTTTFEHALTLVREWGGAEQVVRWGVLRAYATRHGAGPLVTEDALLSELRPDVHNGQHPWQGDFRLGWFDAVASRHALALVGGVDRLLISNVDRLAGLERVRVCTAYEHGDDGVVRAIPAASSPPERSARTGWLRGCQPRYRDLPAWPISGHTLSAQEGAFLDLLQSSDGIGSTIHALSIGPRAADKRILAG